MCNLIADRSKIAVDNFDPAETALPGDPDGFVCTCAWF
jgi:hypothetical protein